MYRIDSMYEPMIEALQINIAANKTERWMASVAYWLAKQQLYNAKDYWLAVASKVTNALPAEDKQAIVDQLSGAEAALLTTASSDWPAIPASVSTIIASWSPTPSPIDLPAYAATKRYAVETGGVVVNGMTVLTDRQSQSLIDGAYAYTQANPEIVVKFKTAAGFVSLDADQVKAVANAVGAHVQASFAEEETVLAAIAAGTITTMAEIDAAAWPSNA